MHQNPISETCRINNIEFSILLRMQVKLNNGKKIKSNQILETEIVSLRTSFRIQRNPKLNSSEIISWKPISIFSVKKKCIGTEADWKFDQNMILYVLIFIWSHWETTWFTVDDQSPTELHWPGSTWIVSNMWTNKAWPQNLRVQMNTLNKTAKCVGRSVLIIFLILNCPKRLQCKL